MGVKCVSNPSIRGDSMDRNIVALSRSENHRFCTDYNGKVVRILRYEGLNFMMSPRSITSDKSCWRYSSPSLTQLFGGPLRH